MNRNYEKGRRFEYWIKRQLESENFCVLRSAGSHSVVDIVGFRQDSCLLVQAKTTGETIANENDAFRKYQKEIESLAQLEVPEICRKQFWIKHKRGVVKLNVPQFQ